MPLGTLALAKEAFLRSVLLRLAPARSAPAKLAPINRLRWNTARMSFAPARSTPARSRCLSWAFSSAHAAEDLVLPARKSASPSARDNVLPSTTARTAASAQPRNREFDMAFNSVSSPNMMACFHAPPKRGVCPVKQVRHEVCAMKSVSLNLEMSSYPVRLLGFAVAVASLIGAPGMLFAQGADELPVRHE